MAELDVTDPNEITEATAADVDSDDYFLAVVDGEIVRISYAETAALYVVGAGAKPLAGDRLWVPATDFITFAGSPSLGLVQNRPAWLLDASTTESVVAGVMFPVGWATARMDVYWSNNGAGAGDVRFERRIGSGTAAGGALTTASSTAVVATAAVLDELAVTTLHAAVTCTVGNNYGLRVQRTGGDGTDTLANDVAVLGVEFVRLT